MTEWRDLSNGELHARLAHRLVTPQECDRLVAARDDEDTARTIDAILDA